MKRTPLTRRTPLKSKPKTKSKIVTRPKLDRCSPLKRVAMKRRSRRRKPGDDPRYKRWIKTQPCVVGGKRCGKVDPHHLIDGKGEARKGIGQTAPDKFLIPMCRRHHDNFHDGKGIFAGWDDAQRLTFQEQEVERLQSIWRDLNELDVLQEPERLAV